LCNPVTLKRTAEFTGERNRANVMYVTKRLIGLRIYRIT